MRTFCFALAVFVLGSSCFASGTTEVVVTRASVSYLEGQVTVGGAAAAIGDAVPLGSTVKTEPLSLCDIQWNAKNLIHMAEDTAFVFDPSNLQSGSELSRGAIALVLKKLTVGSGGKGFLVRAPGAAAGVRGTSFFLKAIDESTTYVCCCNGALQMEDGSGNAVLDYEAPHHKAYLFSSASGSVQATDSTLLYHTDADMEQAAARIGVSIDWNSVDR
jgi:hypothetical protein